MLTAKCVADEITRCMTVASSMQMSTSGGVRLSDEKAFTVMP